HHDLVTGLERIEVVEGGQVGGAVAGDRGVPRLSGQGGSRIVAGARLELHLVGSLHHHHREADLRYHDGPHRTPGRRGGDHWGHLGWRNRRGALLLRREVGGGQRSGEVLVDAELP